MQKKTFKDEFNPALQFISASENEQKEPENIFADIPMKRNPLYIETKSKRVQLLLQPSLHGKLKDMAKQQETSLNDLIHTILEKTTQKVK